MAADVLVGGAGACGGCGNFGAGGAVDAGEVVYSPSLPLMHGLHNIQVGTESAMTSYQVLKIWLGVV